MAQLGIQPVWTGASKSRMGGGGRRSSGFQSDYGVTPDQAESYLSWLARQSGGAIETLGKALDTPGAIGRGLLAGKPGSGFSWDSDERVYGTDINRQIGLTDERTNPWVEAGLGLATEILTDPLAIISTPARTVTAAGRAAKAAGLLDKASDAVLAAKGIDALKDGSRTARRAMSWAEKNKLPISAETFGIRPLVGPRLAKRQTTLDEVVRFADEAAQNNNARQAVDAYLAKQGIRYDQVKNQKLGRDFGLGVFGLDPVVTFNVPGGEGLSDTLDAAGQTMRWAFPTRYASSMFDRRVGGQYGTGEQVAALKHTKEMDKAIKEGRILAARHAMKIDEINLSPQAKSLLGDDSLMSEAGNDFLTRVFENTTTFKDKQLIRAIGPKLNEAVASWQNVVKQNVSEGRRLGMDINEFTDPQRGVQYSPRAATEIDFGEYGSGLSRNPYNTRGTEQRARQDFLLTFGGTLDLREISKLPEVRQFAREGRDGSLTQEQVGNVIADYINTKHSDPSRMRTFSPSDPRSKIMTQQQGEKIASFMQRMDARLPDDVSVFSEHPVSAQARNIVSQSMARGNAKHVYQSLAEEAVSGRRSTQSGLMRSLKDAMRDVSKSVGLKTGDEGGELAFRVEESLKEAIAARTGEAVENINLDNFSVPDEAVNRLMRIQDFYQSPKAQEDMFKFFNGVTSLFKGFVLAWPSRFVRDFYSNVFSVYLESGDVLGTLNGMSVARSILTGNFDTAASGLKAIPHYAGITNPTELKRRFMEDAAGAGILQSLASSDLVTTKAQGSINQLVPGSTPIGMGDALGELGQNWQNFGRIKGINSFETKNPLLNAQEKLSNYIDSQARLGGYIALLQQGVTPDVAAKRITDSLVDYGSLTTMERNFFRNVFPWWAYNSRIGKYVVQNMAKNPGGSYAQTVRALNTLQRGDEDVFIPEALRQSFAVRIPNNDPNMQTYLKDIDLPGVDVLSMFSPSLDPAKAVQDTASNFLQQTNPYLRFTIEQAMGYDTFSKRPINEAITPTDRLLMAWGLTEGPTPLSRVGNLIPGLSRPLSLAGGLADERLTWEQRLQKQALNQLSGVKIQSVDEQYLASDKTRLIEEENQGNTRTRVIKSVPKDSYDKLSPEEIFKAEVLRYSQGQQSKKYRERMKAKEREEKFKTGVNRTAEETLFGY